MGLFVKDASVSLISAPIKTILPSHPFAILVCYVKKVAICGRIINIEFKLILAIIVVADRAGFILFIMLFD